MKYSTLFLFMTFLLFFNVQAQDQPKSLRKGDKLFNNYSYFNAIKIYEKVAQKGYFSVELFQKLGDANFFNSQYVEANRWYERLFQLNKETEKIYFFRYAQTLKAVADFNKSNEYMLKFALSNKQNDIALEYLNNNDYLDRLSRVYDKYNVESINISSSYSDYGASIFKGSLIFSSTRKSRKKIDPRTNEYFASLYSASLPLLEDSKSYGDVRLISIDKKSKFNESTPVFSKDGRTIYFTKGGYFYPKRKSPSKRVELKIYTAQLNKKGKWKKMQELAINNSAYNCAHPALSPDEKTLYFVSDMPGGFGDTDIYKVSIENHQTVGNAINLGANVNTSGKESYPFVSNENDLFFSSNGHLGLGGLDIFKSALDSEGGTPGKAVNVGKPINSSFDDFCFLKLNNSFSGYFSSNRLGGTGKDDIYFFEEKKDSPVNFLFVDEQTQKPLENLTVTIYDIDHNFIVSGMADKDGKYSTTLNQSDNFTFYVEIKGADYGIQEMTFTNTSADHVIKTTFPLSKPIQTIDLGTDLAKLLVKPIYFSVDKYEIRKDAEVELQKLVEFMKEYSSAEIEIRTHTDSRLSASLNMELSIKRGQSVKKYLTSNGVSGKRIKLKAFGETQLVNHCADGVPCSEAEHKENRRCEFVIVKL